MKLHEMFPEISLNPNSAKDIKHWILQLAVEGKLTKKWREEKGLSNLQRQFSTENNFSIPDTWKSKKLKEIGKTQTGGTPSKSNPEFFGNDVPFIKPGDVNNWSVNYFNEGLSEKGKLNLGRSAPKGSILMVCLGSIGKCALIEKECCFNQQINSLTALDQNPSYLLIAMSSSYFQKEAWSKSTSTTIALLNKSNWENISLPLPPLEEQQAIVTIVEDLFKEVDELEAQATQRIALKRSYAQAALQRLCEADTAKEGQQIVSVFPEIFNDKQTIKTLRETILQLAVQGKLTTKWRSKEGDNQTAHELLAQIKAEKAQLIKDKKIKAEKPLPPIEADEIPFELPEGWVWCRLGEVSKQITDGEHQTPPRLSEGKLLLSAKNIRDGYIDYENCDYISEENFQKSIKRCHPEVGDLLIVSVGGTIGRISMVNKDIPFALVRSVAMIKNTKLVPDYLRWVMNSPLMQETVENRKRGGAQPCLYLSEIKEFKFPLAPVSEQQIIIEKVNALMGLCDELEREVEGKENILQKI